MCVNLRKINIWIFVLAINTIENLNRFSIIPIQRMIRKLIIIIIINKLVNGEDNLR